MPYIGNRPVDPTDADNFVVDNFTSGVDFTAGSSTTVTLSAAPATENAIIVTMDGVTQHHDTYSVSRTTLTFDAAIPSGVSNIEVQFYIKAILTTVADLSVTSGKIASGAVTAGKIGTGGVSANTQLAAGVVTSHAIAAASVTAGKLAPGAGSPAWNLLNSNNQTLTVNNNYAVNTHAGAITVVLPSGTSIGQSIRIADIKGSASSNNITVDRATNSQKIQGNSSANLVISTSRANIGLIYISSDDGWILAELA